MCKIATEREREEFQKRGCWWDVVLSSSHGMAADVMLRWWHLYQTLGKEVTITKTLSYSASNSFLQTRSA